MEENLKKVEVARQKSLNLTNYRKTFTGTVVKICNDCIYIDVFKQSFMIYGNWKKIQLGMQVECTYACSPPAVITIAVFTEKQLAELGVKPISIMGDISSIDDGVAWIHFEEIAKIGFYMIRTGETLVVGDSKAFDVIAVSPFDCYVYELFNF